VPRDATKKAQELVGGDVVMKAVDVTLSEMRAMIS
jgi:hypothetical protein